MALPGDRPESSKIQDDPTCPEPGAAQRAAAANVTASLAALLSPARAEASRRNGAKSRGPKTAEGKARSARNALKHGLCAQRFVALGDEDLAAFDALEAALTAELAPQGALEAVLVRRIVAATWRLERAERLEAEVFAQNISGTTSFGLAMIRDCNGARAFDTLLRYRGTTLAELWRSLRTLKALQAEARAIGVHDRDPAEHAPRRQPNEPEARTKPRSPATPPAAEQEACNGRGASLAPALPPDPARPARTVVPGRRAALSPKTPIEPKVRTNPGETASFYALGAAARPASSAGACASRHEGAVKPLLREASRRGG